MHHSTQLAQACTIHLTQKRPPNYWSSTDAHCDVLCMSLLCISNDTFNDVNVCVPLTMASWSGCSCTQQYQQCNNGSKVVPHCSMYRHPIWIMANVMYIWRSAIVYMPVCIIISMSVAVSLTLDCHKWKVLQWNASNMVIYGLVSTLY